MSAKTRQKPTTLEALTLLQTTATTLLANDRRSPHMTKTLIKALQLYKENRLGFVASTEIHNEDMSEEAMCMLFSSKLTDVGFEGAALNWLRSKKVEYVGEVVGIELDLRRNKGVKRAPELVLEHLNSLGLSVGINPFSYGWRPPYWSESWFIQQLDRPSIDDSSTFPHWRRAISEKKYFLGNLLRGTQGHIVSAHRWEERLMDSNIRMAMFVPPTWTAPTEIPEIIAKRLSQLQQARTATTEK